MHITLPSRRTCHLEFNFKYFHIGGLVFMFITKLYSTTERQLVDR